MHILAIGCQNLGTLNRRVPEVLRTFKKASEYDQVIKQSHTADQPTQREEAPQDTNSHKTLGRQYKKSNQASRL